MTVCCVCGRHATIHVAKHEIGGSATPLEYCGEHARSIELLGEGLDQSRHDALNRLRGLRDFIEINNRAPTHEEFAGMGGGGSMARDITSNDDLARRLASTKKVILFVEENGRWPGPQDDFGE
jgi:hypothetical protein